MAQVLGAVPQHGLDAVLVAVELVLESGRPSAEHVLNLLARLREGPPPAPVATSLTVAVRRPTTPSATTRCTRRWLMTDLIAELKGLRLYGMASGYAEFLQNSSSVELQQTEWLLRHLVQAEQTDRGLRSIRYQMQAARFPIHRDLAGFDFEQSKVDPRQIEQFTTLAFTERAENIVLIDGTGTGKTHLATALGVQAITQHAKRARFFRPLS